MIGGGVGAAAGVTIASSQGQTATSTSSPVKTPVASPTPTKSPTPVAQEEGTRTNPFAIGTTLTASSNGRENWTVTVSSVSLNATDVILAENPYNDVPPEGMQYGLVSIDATYTGVDAGDPGNAIRMSFVSAEGRTYDEFDVSVVTPNALFGQNEIYAGTSTTGNIAVLIPSTNAEQGVWALSVDFGDPAFFAAQ
ncbi:hypothetical protein SAMN05216554_0061 [Herbiconiux ginsengi]|uniref:DUF4352 domain-containing protein n=1 Tax=Herbiconiux ginsengi TaxID=381665 RepID=A0A1H3U262_9MICO|nr:hypothetical protein SAMN05216554_0061 [Herbiconiux ginsengi]